MASASPVFATTQWTQVLEARGDSESAQNALGTLCEAYYRPVFGFIRLQVRDEEAARDLTQEFFARILAGHSIDSIDRERGRFRSFLLGAVKHFLADMRDRDLRLKRGGGVSLQSIDASSDSSVELQIPDPAQANPEKEYDRKWALTILDRALGVLANETRTSGKLHEFEVMKPWLTGETTVLSQAEAATQLGLSEGALKVAVHRLRRRFRELVKAEIAQTLNDRSQVQNELECLMMALRG